MTNKRNKYVSKPRTPGWMAEESEGCVGLNTK